MFPFFKIAELILRGAISVMLEPMFWLILALVGFQYWQLQRSQLRMFGVCGYSLRPQVMMAAIYGIIGGLIGSLLLTFVGVTLNQLGLSYIWPLALALMMINMRFLCFAYAGGLVALSKVVFGWPEVNVPQVLALVACLHVTESILIAISGRYSAVPVILRQDNGRLVGAFNLQNFWPLPLVLLAAVTIPGEVPPDGVIKMPDWWPLLPLSLEAPAGHHWVYAMMPVVAALGYADMAVSSSPAERRRQSAAHLFIYSVLLLILAILSSRYAWLQAVAAIVSPLGHELLIQLDHRQELKGVPRFVPPAYGLMVLDTLADSPARKIGLRPGDIIFNLAGRPVNTRGDLAEAIYYAPIDFTIDFYRDGLSERRQARFMDEVRRLGVILVPDGQEENYMQLAPSRFGLFDWLKRRWENRKK